MIGPSTDEGQTSSQPPAAKRPHAKADNEIQEEGGDEPTSKRRKKSEVSTPPPRISYFIAFRINDPCVTESVLDVQEKMVATREHFRASLKSYQKLHVTLHIFELEADDDKSRAIQAVKEVYDECKTDFASNPAIVHIKGMGHFDNNRVLFGQIEDDDIKSRVAAIAYSLREKFEQLQIPGETREYTPHMTIALRKEGTSPFPEDMWQEFKNHDFGKQRIEGIQLL